MITQQENIRRFLNHRPFLGNIDYEILKRKNFKLFERLLVGYLGSEGDEVQAYLFIPKSKVKGSILVHHQHAGKWHLGKSEIAGIRGDKYQFFGPALAKRGFLCLAPDSICFEDRRLNKKALELDQEEADWLQHYNQMAYRLLRGSTLMKKVLDDASMALSLMLQLSDNPHGKVGLMGHSYGGNTVIFQQAVDQRVSHICTSGAACSFAAKIANNIGIEMAEVIPGLLKKFDIIDLLKVAAPNKMLLVGSKQDPFTKDIKVIYKKLKKRYHKVDAPKNIDMQFYKGKHPLTKKRMRNIISWFSREMQ